MKSRWFRIELVFAALFGVFAILWHTQVFADVRYLGSDAFDGWAWSGTPAGQAGAAEGAFGEASALGFIHLHCESIPEALQADYCLEDASGTTYPNVTLDFDEEIQTGPNAGDPNPEYGNVSGWGWTAAGQIGTAFGGDFCDPAAETCPQTTGWLNFDPSPDETTFPGCGYPTEPCVDAQVNTDNREELFGWARFETLAAYGRDTASSNDWGWVLLQGENSADSDEFGVLYRDGYFEGWAWSGGGTLPGGAFDNSVGFGWISFSSGGAGTDDNQQGGFLATEQGDVYARGGIENPYGLSGSDPHATFLLFGSSGAESFVNFETALGSAGTLGAYTEYDLPDVTVGYKNDLGRIDFEKLTTITNVATDQNVYGDTVVDMELADFSTISGNYFLDGQVIVAQESGVDEFVLDNAVTFLNGTAVADSGANYDGSGTIIVNGDLRINANMFYQDSALVDRRNLASVAWIVRGDVIVGENVSNLVGAFFVLGDEIIGDGSSDGTVFTLPASDSQLTVYGMMMARGFDLQRSYKGQFGVDEPAELFYYDGRVLVNTPPGVKDYTATLPQFQ